MNDRDARFQHTATARQAVSGINTGGVKAVFDSGNNSRSKPGRLLRAAMRGYHPGQPPDRGRYFFVMLMNLISDGARSVLFKLGNSALARSQWSEEPVLESRKFEGFIPNFRLYLPLSPP